MKPSNAETPISKPSQFYQQRFWKFGYQIAKKIPRGLAEPLVRLIAWLYALGQKKRRQVMVQNLLVPCSGDLPLASKMANRLFQNFAIKLLDLWRYETGGSVENLFQQFEGIEHLDSAL